MDMKVRTIGPITNTLAAFVADCDWQSLPEEARVASKMAITDCIGGALAGLEEGPTKAAIAVAKSDSGNVPVWGAGWSTTERNAAFVNGTMAHAHDIDDTNESMRGHPSAPVVPAIFALAPETGCDGKALITAYTVGVEIEAKLGRAMNMEHYERGWHTTSTLGCMGAAAAAANLLGLDADHAAVALAIAGSMAGGLRANFGTMTKPLHSGLAAQNGVLAARLAQAGISANPNAIEATEGFIDLFCGRDHVAAEKATANLGAPFDVVSPGIIFKLYPTCSLTHCVLDILMEGLQSGEIKPAEMLKLDCGIGYRCENTLPYHNATTGLEGKFSMEYCVAAALQYGRVWFPEFADDKVNNPAIRDLYSKINIYVHPDLTERDSVFFDFADIVVTHKDGSVFKKRLSTPKGHPKNPLSWEDLEKKFRACADMSVGEKKASHVWRGLYDLDNLDSAKLVKLL